MLHEPPASPYDLNFELLGYRIRVFWGFWLMAAILGWGWSNSVNSISPVVGMDSPGAPVLLMIWMVAVFVSILVHELGHALAFSFYGTQSHIVLYHFGGLAVPSSFGSWNAARQRHIGPEQNIVISAAGPALQLGLAVVTWAIGYSLGVPMDLMGIDVGGEDYPGSAAIYGIFNALLFPSAFWALLNLAPILPLDGGQILRSLMMLTNARHPIRLAYAVSIGTGLVLGLFFMSRGNTFAGIMFFMFAANNWQALQFGGGAF